MSINQPGFGIEPSAGPILSAARVVDHPWIALPSPQLKEYLRPLSDRTSEVGIVPIGNDGWFDISSLNDGLDVDYNGGGEQNLTIPSGRFTGQQLAANINTILVNSVHPSLTCVYFEATNKFRFGPAANTFAINWNSGASSAANCGDELGFSTAADDTGAVEYSADSERYATHSCYLFDAGAGSTIDPEVFAIALGGDSLASFSDVVVYLNATFLGSTRQAWAAGASQTISISTRPDRPSFNPLQIGLRIGAAAMRFCFVSWRHVDASPDHRIGLIKGLELVRSTSYAVAEQQSHALRDPSPGGYYPSQLQQVWEMGMQIPQWPKSEWDSVIAPVVRNGRARGLVVVRNLSGAIDSGYVAALKSAADDGTALWAKSAELPTRAHSGSASDYVSGSFTFRQIP